MPVQLDAGTPTPQLGIGSAMVSPKDGMLLVYVPEGEFEMGSDENEDEKPIHTVYLDSFWIDQTVVTNGMYAKCMEAGVCEPPSSTGSSTRSDYYGNPDYDEYPVLNVNWDQAHAYCQWAGRRLLTEAEWEKGARGTGGQKYPWGDGDIAGNLLNSADSNTSYDWSDTTIDDGYADTAPVGSYPDGASPYGALDMAGNVWEWVADWYDENYYSNSPDTNPTGPSSGVDRVLRGSSWYEPGVRARSADRGKSNPMHAGNSFGFRCSLSP